MYLLLIYQPVFSTISLYITRYPVHNFADRYIADIRYLKHCLRLMFFNCLSGLIGSALSKEGRLSDVTSFLSGALKVPLLQNQMFWMYKASLLIYYLPYLAMLIF